MKNLRYMTRVAIQKICSVRVVTFALIMLLISWNFNEPIRRFSAEMDYPCSIWTFPFMLTGYMYLIMMLFAVIYVNSDIPFTQQSNMYGFLRTGRKKWGIIQLCMIFLRSFALVMITVVCSIISILPRVELTGDWGNLIKTMSMGQMGEAYWIKYFFNPEALIKFSPIELMCLTILISTLVVTVLGIVMFLISLYTNRVISVSIAAAFIVVLVFVTDAHPKLRHFIARFTPTIWPQVAMIYTPDLGYLWLPSVRYMLTFLGIAIAVMSVLVVRRIHYIEFNWENEDE